MIDAVSSGVKRRLSTWALCAIPCFTAVMIFVFGSAGLTQSLTVSASPQTVKTADLQKAVTDSRFGSIFTPGTVIVTDDKGTTSIKKAAVFGTASNFLRYMRRPGLTEDDVQVVNTYTSPNVSVSRSGKSIVVRGLPGSKPNDIINGYLIAAIVGFAHKDGQAFLDQEQKRTTDSLVLIEERSSYLADLAK